MRNVNAELDSQSNVCGSERKEEYARRCAGLIQYLTLCTALRCTPCKRTLCVEEARWILTCKRQIRIDMLENTPFSVLFWCFNVLSEHSKTKMKKKIKPKKEKNLVLISFSLSVVL